MESIAEMSGERATWNARSTYPKRLELRPDQPYRDRWQMYFDDQWLSERARLGLSYDDSLLNPPTQQSLL